MGTKMAPAYANLFMGTLEPKLISKAADKIQMWKIIIWTGSDTQLEEYMSKINSIHPTIKFTYESDDQELTFLYVTFHEKTNHIALDVNLRYKPK
jgi:hypothetical protein